ncbi:hypothetical protein V6N13_084084 [Hibiscus sabdariffa]
MKGVIPNGNSGSNIPLENDLTWHQILSLDCQGKNRQAIGLEALPCGLHLERSDQVEYALTKSVLFPEAKILLDCHVDIFLMLLNDPRYLEVYLNHIDLSYGCFFH